MKLPKDDCNRPAFTLVEMLVATALILFIMVILSQAFVAGLGSFRELKAIGDMEEKLRVAVTQIRKDLAADHFEGRRRLSDTNFWMQPVREGFVHIMQRTGSLDEGMDSQFVHSYRSTTPQFLQMAVKLRGNQQEKFFTTTVPDATLLNATTNFFSQSSDGRFQDASNTNYNSPWAEVAYFLMQAPTTAGSSTPLYTLYRSQLVVVPDNRSLNWGNPPATGFPITTPNVPPGYGGFSCKVPAGSNRLYFNNPGDLALGTNRAMSDVAATHDITRASVLMTDVLSFDVRVLKYQLNPPAGRPNLDPDFTDVNPGAAGTFDTYVPYNIPPIVAPATAPGYVIKALEITLRVWDPKSEQARQVTIIQDM